VRNGGQAASNGSGPGSDDRADEERDQRDEDELDGDEVEGDDESDEDEDGDDTDDPSALARAEQIAAEEIAGSVGQALAELAASAPGVETRRTPRGADYLANGVLFARSDALTGSFRLRPEIATAALRTEGTRPSPLGREWVAFTPVRFDRYALDRVTAWFELARRVAGDGRGRGGR
jgi:hypothetical protein